MTEVKRSKRYDVTASDLWGRIGNFQDVGWHPAVASTEASNEGNTRKMTLADGAVVVETMVGEGERSYSYRLDEGPMPVADYTATLSVVDVDGDAEVRWEASFRPEGASEEEAAAAIAGIFDAGLGAL